ncbi:hypothetical protein GCK72_009928 [Caenorhabditis remanei]|uniref:Uncharacterized protein n=2 Tax=Caenorhabditis remanei TaxID=31234 RepID=A0A6A5H5F3_CAERE|nr:hypothetical protein GCK72_009928 [Caenorhabditis remanei]KAF1761672.1 hypothetical protein GCK72_009928 [Caenorhabditis remanei]
MLDPDDLSPGEIVFSADDTAGERSFLAEFFGKKQSLSIGTNSARISAELTQLSMKSAFSTTNLILSVD